MHLTFQFLLSKSKHCLLQNSFAMIQLISAEYYGFIVEDNDDDLAFLSLSLLPQLKGLPAKQCLLHASGVPSWELMKALRLACENANMRKKVAFKAAAGQPCSREGELLVP